MKCGSISAHKLENERSKVLLCPFDFKTRPLGLSFVSKGLQNISQVPGNALEVRQNYDARKAVSATFSVLK